MGHYQQELESIANADWNNTIITPWCGSTEITFAQLALMHADALLPVQIYVDDIRRSTYL